jgi:hypothetical protein
VLRFFIYASRCSKHSQDFLYFLFRLIAKETTERSELSHSIKKKIGMAKKIKAPIPLFKNLHERQARWASSSRRFPTR